MNYRRPLSTLSLLVACSGTSCGPDTTITVSSTADGGEGSLRAAIAAANRADPTKTVRIEVPSGTYSLSLCGADDTNDAGDLDLTTLGSVMIVGIGPDVVINQTCSGERVLDAFGTGILTLIDVTISGGSLTEQDPTLTARGGGVRAAASVVLQRAKITGNAANSTAGAPIRGGGLFTGGDLVASDAQITSNTAGGASATADAEGGGAYVVGAITIKNGGVSQNNAQGGNARGGGVAQASTSAQAVRIFGTTFDGNVAAGVVGISQRRAPGDARGGALAVTGVTALEDATFSANQALGGNVNFQCDFTGGVESYVICFGRYPGANAQGGAVASAADLTLTRGTYSDNLTEGGNGIYINISGRMPAAGWTGDEVRTDGALVVNGSVFSRNHARLPDSLSPPLGTFAAVGAASATIRDAHFDSNGILPAPNTAVVNGPLGAGVAVSGSLDIARSQFTKNFVGVSAASLKADSITFDANQVVARVSGRAILSNATLSDNSDGIHAAEVQLDHVTMVNNGTTLVTQHLTTHASVSIGSGGPTCTSGVVIDASSYNWFADSSCALAGVGDVQSSPTFTLQPLGDYGGPVQTQPPSPGSALVDAVPRSACTLPLDARGVARPQGSGCDIGAVELAVAGAASGQQ